MSSTDSEPARLAGLPRRRLTDQLTLIEATSLSSRLRGLGGLDALAPQLGLQIRTASVHTFTMRFAIDLIWLARDGSVLSVDAGVGRRRVRVCWGARWVIETTAGQADAFLAALEP